LKWRRWSGDHPVEWVGGSRRTGNDELLISTLESDGSVTIINDAAATSPAQANTVA
jgi:hypothetical protein